MTTERYKKDLRHLTGSLLITLNCIGALSETSQAKGRTYKFETEKLISQAHKQKNNAALV